MAASTPIPASALNPPPNPFEAMLQTLPSEIRATVLAMLRDFRIVHKDDPILQLMMVLGLYAAYFQKIPERIIQAGKTNEAQSVAALDALDVRLRNMRAFTVAIQKATDRLTAAPQEIADKFPVEQIANELRAQIDTRLKMLPLGQFEESTERVNRNLEMFLTQAAEHFDKIETELSRIQKLAAEIAKLELPKVSWWRDAGFITVGAVIAALLLWWFMVVPMQKSQPDMKAVADLLASESFIGQKAAGGFLDDQPVIIIKKENLKDAHVDPTSGSLIIHLNR
jgi:hypothetical protein